MSLDIGVGDARDVAGIIMSPTRHHIVVPEILICGAAAAHDVDNACLPGHRRSLRESVST